MGRNLYSQNGNSIKKAGEFYNTTSQKVTVPKEGPASARRVWEPGICGRGVNTGEKKPIKERDLKTVRKQEQSDENSTGSP